jgi:hypothetical protein
MNTTHRAASRAKRQYAGQLPKLWQPKLAEVQRLDAKIIHWDLIDRFTSGEATSDDLWSWIETGYTYSQIMQLLMDDGTEFTQEAVVAISDQLDIYGSVITRFRVHGRVAFSGPELLVARAAAHVMDGLLDLDRNGIAVQAARWTMVQMQRIRALGSSAMRATA